MNSIQFVSEALSVPEHIAESMLMTVVTNEDSIYNAVKEVGKSENGHEKLVLWLACLGRRLGVVKTEHIDLLCDTSIDALKVMFQS